MKFIDANIFVYAFLETKRKLTEKEIRLKQKSKEIVSRIESGEKAATSVIQVSEISNILEARGSNRFAREVIESILLKENIDVVEVNRKLYATSLELAKIYDININDCVAAIIMKMNNINEIYSFDSDFDKIDGIKRIEK